MRTGQPTGPSLVLSWVEWCLLGRLRTCWCTHSIVPTKCMLASFIKSLVWYYHTCQRLGSNNVRDQGGSFWLLKMAMLRRQIPSSEDGQMCRLNANVKFPVLVHMVFHTPISCKANRGKRLQHALFKEFNFVHSALMSSASLTSRAIARHHLLSSSFKAMI